MTAAFEQAASLPTTTVDLLVPNLAGSVIRELLGWTQSD